MKNIDTHLHLGGCISPSFVWETIKKNNLKHLAESYEDVVAQMTFMPNEPKTFHRFLDKFKILDELKWTEELIDASIIDISNQLEANHVDYAWIDFSINKYMDIGWHKHQAIRFIYDAFQRHRPGGVGLLLSIKYESTKASQKQYAKLIENEDVAKYLIGIDLVGDETYFDSEFYAPIFKDWNKARKITRAHVGESQSARNIQESIERLNVTNIAHGFKIVDHEDMIKLALDRNITFDLALTSNYVTGVCNTDCDHPILKMLEHGLKVTIGSDDPIQCNTTLNIEYILAESLGVTSEQCEMIRQTAIINSILTGLR
jgi:adenosine deaminase